MDFSCSTVDKGHYYPDALDVPVFLGFVSSPVRQQRFQFGEGAVTYNLSSDCASNWNKLWGSSRCGYFHPHHADSDRFVWRRRGGVVEIAAYAYDGGRKPYSPPDPNLLQPFRTLLSVGVPYTAKLDVGPARTVYSLEGGSPLLPWSENVTVLHANACTNAAEGYALGLYFGGSCPAPSPVTVCYAPGMWPIGVSVAIALALLLVLLAIAGAAARCCCPRWCQRCCRTCCCRGGGAGSGWASWKEPGGPIVSSASRRSTPPSPAAAPLL